MDTYTRTEGHGTMRILIVGNVAQNGWLLTRFLRDAGQDAYLIYDATAPAHWLPEWEECHYHPKDIERLSDGRTLKEGETWIARTLPPYWRKPGWCIGVDSCGSIGDPRWTIHLARLARGCDMTILTGPWAAYGPYLGVPYITFEHATMRHVPSGEREGRADAVALARAYRGAAWNVITNADCRRAAVELGIEQRSSFIPHPVDTERFRPLEVNADGYGTVDNAAAGEPALSERGRQCISDAAAGGKQEDGCLSAAGYADADSGDRPERGTTQNRLRWQLTQGHPERLIFLAPARQATKRADWGTKNNAVIFEAFSQYIDSGCPPAQLVAADYGDSAREMHTLVNKLDLNQLVSWFPLQPKRSLLHYYHLADVVLDQFDTSVGSYGTCTVEALACGKNVITHISEAAHLWTANVLQLPPYFEATTPERVAHLLTWVPKVNWKQTAHVHPREWVEQYHSKQIVTAAYLELLERVTHS